jgi:hypothetical protein
MINSILFSYNFFVNIHSRYIQANSEKTVHNSPGIEDGYPDYPSKGFDTGASRDGSGIFGSSGYRILPGMGPSLLRTAAVTDLREIAAFSEGEVLALFGRRGRFCGKYNR